MITTTKAIILGFFCQLYCTQSSVRFGIKKNKLLFIIYGAIFLSPLFHYEVYWHTFCIFKCVVKTLLIKKQENTY